MSIIQGEAYEKDRAERIRQRNRFFFRLFGVIGLGVGCVALGYAFDLFWLRVVGVLVLAPLALIVSVFVTFIITFWVVMTTLWYLSSLPRR